MLAQFRVAARPAMRHGRHPCQRPDRPESPRACRVLRGGSSAAHRGATAAHCKAGHSARRIAGQGRRPGSPAPLGSGRIGRLETWNGSGNEGDGTHQSLLLLRLVLFAANPGLATLVSV